MKQLTKSLSALILSLFLVGLFFTAGMPEAAAFFTIITILIIEVVRYEVKHSKPVKTLSHANY